MLKYADLRLAPRVDLSRSVPPPAPFTIFIEPTNVCNFKCVMCPESFPDYQQLAGYYQRMPLDLFAKIVDDDNLDGLSEEEFVGRLNTSVAGSEAS